MYFARGIRRERVFRVRVNPLDMYEDHELYARYRFDREGVIFIAGLLGNRLRPMSARSYAVPGLYKVMATLRFLATGSFQMVVGDMAGLSQPTICRHVWQVVDALVEIAPRFIKFPTGDEALAVQAAFLLKHGMPGVVGAIDCTHVHIAAPTLNEDIYVNRKGYHSVNVQATCDDRHRVTSVEARWPGSTHDSRILRESELSDMFTQGRLTGVLLGDSGYPCQGWLFTPYGMPRTEPEMAFNR